MHRENNSPNTEQRQKWDFDYRLIQLSLQGDEDSWNDLYRDALPFAWNTVRKCNQERVLSEYDMEDIIQEAFVRCYERRAWFEPRSLFRTWLCGFVTKVALEYKRKHYKHLIRQRMYSYRPESSFPPPEYACIIKESDFCLWLAFDSLTKKHQLLLSCYVLGWESKHDVRQILHTTYSKMREENNRAINIFKRRYVTLYYGKRREMINAGTTE